MPSDKQQSIALTLSKFLNQENSYQKNYDCEILF